MEAYPQVIREMIRGRHGVYALYKGGRLYYVGLASNLLGRVNGHLRDRHRGKWDRFSVYLTVQSSHIKELESLLLRIISPKGNRAGGRLSRSINLLPILNRQLKDVDADRRAAILGGSIADRRRRSKARRRKGVLALAGFSDRSIALRGVYRKKAYRASLRPTGSIRVRKRLYDSPSAAAEAIVNSPINGWHFWKYRGRDGKWHSLKSIRR